MEQITLDIPHWKGAIVRWLREHLLAQFPTVGGIYFENEEFDPPDYSAADTLASSWFYVEIKPTFSKPVEMGPTGHYQTDGILLIHCRTPKDIMTNQADILSSAVEKIFRGTTAGYAGLYFGAPFSKAVRAGEVEDRLGGYFQVTVTCPFRIRASK